MNFVRYGWLFLALAGMSVCGRSQAVEATATVGEVQKMALPGDLVHPAQHPDETLLGPAQVRRFYALEGVNNGGEGQTIALIIAKHDPVLDQDLEVFSRRFGLPSCRAATGCLRQILGPSVGPRPSMQEEETGSFVEISMDVEWSHAIAPLAKLMVVEAPHGSWEEFLLAVDTAVAKGATVVSLSLAEPQKPEHKEMYLKGNAHFTNDAAVYVASGGDHAHGARWPASSPDVVGVGGTTIRTDATGARLGETAWISRPAGDRYVGTGGGLSLAETEPAAQVAYGLPGDEQHMRGTPDVGYYASSRTPLAVYDSNVSAKSGVSGWRQGGGTSAGTPQWAGLLAVANSMRAAAGKVPLSKFKGGEFGDGTLAALYTVGKKTPGAFFDVTEGSNKWGDKDACGAECEAGVGYDYLTGLGSPNGAVLLKALAALP
jgi:subtilase family serine protease